MLFVIVLLCCALSAQTSANVEPASCGKQQLNTAFLIHYGKASKAGDWSWHAAIYRPVGNKFTNACGGNIIHKNYILTAAHCFYSGIQMLSEKEISVRLGQVDLKEDTPFLQVLNVAKIIIHPNFNIITGWTDDIAIIKLPTDIVMTPFVQPVCLWKMDSALGEIVGRSGIVIGFGLNENDMQSWKLQQATMTVVNTITCLENDRETYGRVLTSTMFCASGKGDTSPCNGDSGGGLFFEFDGVWYLRGLVSVIAKRDRTTNLCDPSKYTVFTDVSKYSDWIAESTVGDTTNRSCLGEITPKGAMCNVANRFDHDFLLIHRYKNIVRWSLDGGQGSMVANASYTFHIDHDCLEGRFYWIDFDSNKIHSATYDGTDQKSFLTDSNGELESVAIDWISRRIYWTDSKKKTIEVADLKHPDLRNVLKSYGHSVPSAIAVDPLQSKLYWLVLEDEKFKIETSNLDGTDSQTLLADPDIMHPRSVRVSPKTGELCYTDSGTKKIDCMDPRSEQIRTIVSNLANPFGLAITDKEFYWSDSETHSIQNIAQNGIKRTPLKFTAKFSPGGILAVNDNCPFYTSPCATNNGNCPANTICLRSDPEIVSGISCK